MDALLVNGDEIELTPDPPWRWMVPPVRLTVSSMASHRMKAKGEFVVWESEILLAGLQGAGQLYSAPGFDTPGSVLTVTLAVTPGTMSASVKDVKQPVATVATSGTFVASVVPAVNPATGVPDPVVVKTGTWAVATQVQDIAVSGQPPATEQTGDEKDAPGVGSDAATAASSQTADDIAHFVAVVLEDVDGNKLAEHRVAIATPDGRRSSHTLTASGAARVDGIRAEGEAVVQLLDAEIRPPVKRPEAPWLAFTLVDADGRPVANATAQITSPEGDSFAVQTGDKGALRLDNLKQEGLYDFELLFRGPGQDAGVGEGDGETAGGEEGDVGDDAAADGAESGDEEPDERKAGKLLEFEAALFRTNSAVVLPEGEDPSKESHQALSSVGMVATVLRYNAETSGKKLFVAGHTDTTGTVDFNLALSDERAECALALLLGDRQLFVDTANARHTVADYKQVLSWCTRAFPELFDCDPGEIDDKEFTGIEPLKRFQAQYNVARDELGTAEPEIRVDGSIGEDTWGAMFDIYEFALRSELGEDADGTTALRNQLEFVDDARRSLGFSEHHPRERQGEDSTENQQNRRVEILFFDPGEEPDLQQAETDPENSDLYDPDKFRLDPIETLTGDRLDYVLRLLPTPGVPTPRELEFVLSPDGRGWSIAKSSSEAQTTDGGIRELLFKVQTSGTYSLSLLLADGTKIPIFRRVPFDKLDQTSASTLSATELGEPGDIEEIREMQRIYEEAGEPF